MPTQEAERIEAARRVAELEEQLQQLGAGHSEERGMLTSKVSDAHLRGEVVVAYTLSKGVWGVPHITSNLSL